MVRCGEYLEGLRSEVNKLAQDIRQVGWGGPPVPPTTYCSHLECVTIKQYQTSFNVNDLEV